MLKKYAKIASLVFVVFIVAALLAYAAYTQGLWRFNDPDATLFPVRGLDVSHHQGAIDWGKIPKGRYQFVYIKASEGSDHIDELFQSNWDGARSAGLKTGAYHFFTLCKSGAEQAKNFAGQLPAADDMLPPAVDLKFAGNCKARPTREEFLTELEDFLLYFKMHYRVMPVIYTTYSFYDMYLKGNEFDRNPVWIRDIFKYPRADMEAHWALWQYADHMRVPGIEGPVDMNVMRADFFDAFR